MLNSKIIGRGAPPQPSATMAKFASSAVIISYHAGSKYVY